MIKTTKSSFFKYTVLLGQSFILSMFLLTNFYNVNSFADYGTNGGSGTIQKILKVLDGFRNQDGLKLVDPYNCGGQVIYGFVQGGSKPYTVSLSIVNKDRTINRGVNFANDGNNWTTPVSYDSNNSNFIPTGEYVINSSVRDATGATDSYAYSAFIRPPQDCNSSNSNRNSSQSSIQLTQNNNSINSNSSVSNSSSSSKAIVIATQSSNNTNIPLSQTNEVIKVVQTQLLRTGGFAQNNPLLFSSSILMLAFGTSLLIKKPKGIKR
jgi:hypothetical protein